MSDDMERDETPAPAPKELPPGEPMDVFAAQIIHGLVRSELFGLRSVKKMREIVADALQHAELEVHPASTKI